MFWEAKLFANKELRAFGSAEPKVVGQINDYKKVLQARQTEVLCFVPPRRQESIHNCRNERRRRKVGPAIRAVADGGELRMGSPANVGLAIFGFDADQKADGGIGHKHYEKLKDLLGRKFSAQARRR